MSESWSYEDVLLPTVLWADGEEAWKYKTDSVVKLLKSKERLEMGDKNFGEIRGFFQTLFSFPSWCPFFALLWSEGKGASSSLLYYRPTYWGFIGTQQWG